MAYRMRKRVGRTRFFILILLFFYFKSKEIVYGREDSENIVK